MQESQFSTYLNELISWNQKMNLTAITEEKDIYNKLFLDSLAVTKAANFEKPKLSIIDIGSGAGFPGIPLKIVYPNLKLTLVESVKKKTVFLKNLVRELKLEGVQIICERAENLAHLPEFRETFDISLGRAVAKLSVLAEYCLPFLKLGGLFIAPKGEQVEGEVQGASNAFQILGGKLHSIIKYNLSPEEPSRTLVVVQKISKTLDKYPRRAGMAKKKPL